MNSKWPTWKITRRVDKVDPDGLAPVVLRITHERKSSRLAMGLECTSEQWNDAAGEFTRKYPSHKAANEALLKIREQIGDLLGQMMKEPVPFTIAEFQKRFRNAGKKMDLIEYIQGIEARMKAEGRIGYSICFRNASSVLRRFTGERKLPFSELTPSKLEALERFLRDEGCEGGGVAVYMRTIKVAVNRAIKEGHLHKGLYPFEAPQHHGYSLRGLKSDHNPKNLTSDQMAALKAFPFEEYPKLGDSVRYFLLSYYLWGANFTDMAKWKPSDMQGGRIIYYRSKTSRTKKKKTPLTPKVGPEAQAIIEHFHKPGSTYLLPILKGVETTPAEIWNRIKDVLKGVNEDLAEVGQMLGFAEKLHFYQARHTMATTWHFKGVAVSLTSQALGHSSITVTEHYLSKFGNEALDQAAELL